MSLSFYGKSVVITGASRGIGLGIAKGFAQAGASLHLIANEAAVHERARELGATSTEADIADRSAVAAAFEPVARIDVLINNAGLELMTPITDSGDDVEAAFRRIIEINIIGTALVTARALPRMQAGGSIVNTSSIWGRVAEAQFGAYVASKHAIIGLTKTWAKELGARGIRVNAVCPGWVRTDASMRSLGRMAERDAVSEAALLESIVGAQALPGLMEPADIAGTYLFLASELAANITGQSLGVDRGEVPW
ncbi:SDR family oxidoreductase [Mesorhizobium sp. M6A.T.Ce.TU.002.03.1.1]|uniref:SDR family NAD(P)-dependent oxidoreductase n=1 Tax=Mesorhizobium sp. M6A.T.Ce.TU.002.03.1.1 TaxID=2496782 RepID=UPI000FCC7ABE|nr:SDR family oxidoreductase [Mesorhizobium sp. M6A.T.Ce.TU.002.03.1.1]RUU42670.1 SDR family oxidoreductase [Mesorhizobium sp. M6A.T.Ce.TU.002.03.1.1]